MSRRKGLDQAAQLVGLEGLFETLPCDNSFKCTEMPERFGKAIHLRGDPGGLHCLYSDIARGITIRRVSQYQTLTAKTETDQVLDLHGAEHEPIPCLTRIKGSAPA